MTRAEHVMDLLLRWEDLRAQGEVVDLERLCEASPELMEEVREKIGALEAMEERLVFKGVSSSAASVGESQRAGNPSFAHDLGTAFAGNESDFKILRPHARGGLGEVYLAEDTQLGRRVALKVIQSTRGRDQTSRSRFIREAELTGRLEHPGVVPVYSMGSDPNGHPCYSMRFIEGETLQQEALRFHQERQNPFQSNSRDFRRLLSCFISVCKTVAYAHSQGVIHRDIKPANIIIGKYGETLLVDWGLAKKIENRPEVTELHPLPLRVERDQESSHEKGGSEVSTRYSSESPPDALESKSFVDDTFDPISSMPNSGNQETAEASNRSTAIDRSFEQDELTRNGAVLGTPAYMSPEQAMGNEVVDKQSDIYCLGSTLFFLLTATPPVVDNAQKSWMEQLKHGYVRNASSIQKDVPRALDAVCSKAMSYRKSNRYGSAMELADDVECWLADEPVSAWRDTVATRCRRWIKRNQAFSGALAVTLLGSLVVAAAYSAITTAANERLLRSNKNEQAARELAENQSDLAMSGLQSVVFEIQKKLLHVPAAQKVRVRLLEHALQNLGEVAASLERRNLVDKSLMNAHRDLGEVYYEVGNVGKQEGLTAARDHFQRAYRVAQRMLAINPSDIEAKRQVAICLQRLGKVEAAAGSSENAACYQFEALEVLRQLCSQENPREEVVFSLSVSLSLLGELDSQRGETEKALQYFQEALAIREGQAARDAPIPELERDLIVSLQLVGNASMKLGDTKRASECFERAFQASLKRVERFPEDFEALRDHSLANFRLGKLQSTLNVKEEARRFFEVALSMDERRLSIDPANSLALRDVMKSSLEVANSHIDLGHPMDALKHVHRAIEIGHQLCFADPQDRRAIRDVAYAHGKLGDLLGEDDAALQEYQLCIDYMKRLQELAPSETKTLADVALSFTKLGDGYLFRERSEEALDYFSRALVLHRQMSDRHPLDVLTQQNLAAYLQRMAIACRKCGRMDEASQHYEEALRVTDRLAQQNPENVKVQILLVTLLDSRGIHEKAANHPNQARDYLNRALVIARQLQVAGKLTGSDSTWVEDIEAHLREMDQD